MDWQSLFNFFGGAALLAVGWFCKTIYDAIKALEKDLSQHRIESAKTYVEKTAIERLEQRMEAWFSRMYDKIDGKADRE